MSRFSLSTRLTLLALVALAPIVVLVVLSNLEERDSERANGIREASTITQGTAQSLEGFARDLEGFMAATAVVIGTRDLPLTQENTQLYLRSLSLRYDNLASLFITDLDGRVIAQASGDDVGFSLSDRPYIVALRKGAETVWTGGISGLRSGEVVGAHARVIRDEDGNPRAYIIAAFHPADLIGPLPKDIPGDANVFLVDQSGQLVLSVTDPALKSTPTNLADVPAVRGALAGLLVTLDGDTLPVDAGERYGAIAPIPPMGWAVGYTRSQALLNAALRDQLLRDLSILVAATVGAIAALTVVARQMTRPLKTLAGAAADLAVGRRVELPEVHGDPDLVRLQQAFATMSTAVRERERRLREQSRILATLEGIGSWLASDLDFERTVQAIVDAGRRATEADIGAFFYEVESDGDASYQLYGLSGLDPQAVPEFPVPRNAALFAPTFRGEPVMRIDDLLAQDLGSSSSVELPAGLPFRSYLAVPVTGRQGNVLGGLFFGHAEPAAFTDRHEKLAKGLAAWAAVALDNARLYSEARVMQEELLKANKAKDEFLALVSHELRSPTTTIYGGTRLLVSSYSRLDESDRVELLTSVAAEAARLVRLIDNLLVLARIELGKEIETSPVSLAELVPDAVEAFRTLHPNRVIHVTCPEQLPPVMADATYLEQVLQNLLSNANKYSPEREPIEVVIASDAAEVTVAVADHGRGVPPGETGVIFESFYRSERTADMASGHGLGLTVCKRLVEQQGGRIWAENRASGGLRVSFAFPALRDLAGAAGVPTSHNLPRR